MLKPLEYVDWAIQSPRAPHDLSASGMLDDRLVLDRIAQRTPNPPPYHRPTQWRAGGELRSMVAARYDVKPPDVSLATGATGAYAQICAALLSPGDHVLVESPAFEPLVRCPQAFGAQVEALPRHADNGWQWSAETLRARLRETTKLVVLSNLHNPTGALTTTAQLHETLELAAGVGAHVAVDEVYLDFVPKGSTNAAPVATLAPHGISFSSITKAFGYGGLRVGWAVTRDPELSRAMWHAAQLLTGVGLSAPALDAACVVLESADELMAHARAAADRGLTVLQGWTPPAALRWSSPRFGLCSTIQCGPELKGDDIAAALLDDGVKVTPGRFFGDPQLLRLGHGAEANTIQHALDALSRIATRSRLSRAPT